MKKKLVLEKSIFVIILFFLLSCELVAKENAPYVINGEFVTDESDKYDIAGMDLYIKNKSEKQISKFTLVFFLFNEDGNPIEYGQSSIVIDVYAEVDPMDYLSTCISLDRYMYEIPSEPYFIDYLYISRIVYTDGSEWKDSFGMRKF